MNLFVHKHESEYIVCEMAAKLSRMRWVKQCHVSEMRSGHNRFDVSTKHFILHGRRVEFSDVAQYTAVVLDYHVPRKSIVLESQKEFEAKLDTL